MAGLGWQELPLIFVILLVGFGATRLPALSRALGQNARHFKKGPNDDSVARPSQGYQGGMGIA